MSFDNAVGHLIAYNSAEAAKLDAAIPQTISEFRAQAVMLVDCVIEQLAENLTSELRVYNPKRVASFGEHRETGFVFGLWKTEKSGFRLFRKYPAHKVDIGIFDSPDRWLIKAVKDDLCSKKDSLGLPTRKEVFSFEAPRQEWGVSAVAEAITFAMLMAKSAGRLAL